MFTGIVETKGRVTSVVTGEMGRLAISAPEFSDLAVGGSINVNGACLTVTTLVHEGFTVDVVPETLRRTNLSGLQPGAAVNLERPVPVAGRLDGHIVQGHIDGTARVVRLTPEADSKIVEVELAPELARYVVVKGFVAVDGVSLTIVDCDENRFSVAVIPHTLRITTLGDRSIGDDVNVEVDILAKYVERLTASRT
jgi:riboflavin synthase